MASALQNTSEIQVGQYHIQTTLLSFKWNSIRLGGPAHGIVIKTVHKTLPGCGGGQGVGVGVGVQGGGGLGVVGVWWGGG